MNKNLPLALLFFLVFAPLAMAQSPVVHSGQDMEQPGRRSGKNFRVEVLVGAGGLIAGNEHMGFGNRLTADVSVMPKYVFNNEKHAVGLLVNYKYNSHKSKKFVVMGKQNVYDPTTGTWTEIEAPETHDYYNTNWHTLFIAPQYTWTVNPRAKSSLVFDAGVGPILLMERDKRRFTHTDPKTYYLFGVGGNVAVGGRFKVNETTHFLTKLSFYGSSLEPSLYGMDMNVSYVTLSLGFSFGK